MNVFLPQNLNLEEITKFSPPNFSYDIDNFKFICSLVNEVPSFTEMANDSNGFVILNAQKMQSRLHEYRAHIDYLMTNDILESDNQYIIGEKSKGYRFTEKYRTPVQVAEITKPSLVKGHSKVIVINSEASEKYPYLTRWFNSRLTIDFTSAFNFLKKEYEMNRSEKSLYRFNASCVSLWKFALREFYFTCDNTAGRCHSNLTSLKSKLRNFIMYDGQPLVNIDIKNSQPCFSGVLFNPKFYEKSTENGQRSQLLNMHEDKIASKAKIPSTLTNNHPYSIMLEDSSSTNDVAQFLAKIQDGTLYEYLESEISKDCGITFKDRDELKKVIFIVLFTDNRFIGQDEAMPKRLFRKIFPTVYRVFALIKQRDKALLAKMLQRIEANVMLDNVAKRISDEYPDLPLFTIHDSIVVPLGHEEYAARVIGEEMFKKTGMKPSVKFEYWIPDNLSPVNLKSAA